MSFVCLSLSLYLHKSGNFVLFLLYLYRSAWHERMLRKMCFGMNKWKNEGTCGAFQSLRLRGISGVSQPSPEILSPLKKPGLGEERTGNVAKPRVREHHMREESERLEAQWGPLGKKPRKGREIGSWEHRYWKVPEAACGNPSRQSQMSQAVPSPRHSGAGKESLLGSQSRHLWAIVQTASGYEDGHPHPTRPFGLLQYFLFFLRNSNRFI